MGLTVDFARLQVSDKLVSPARFPPSDKPSFRRGTAPRFGESQARAKMRPLHEDRSMDIERINAIGASLADLTQRTLALRGYL